MSFSAKKTTVLGMGQGDNSLRMHIAKGEAFDNARCDLLGLLREYRFHTSSLDFSQVEKRYKHIREYPCTH